MHIDNRSSLFSPFVQSDSECISANETERSRHQVPIIQKSVISFVLRFPIECQPCLKMGKWNRHTSSFNKLSVKQSKVGCRNYHFMTVIMYFAYKRGCILFHQRMGNATIQDHFHSAWLHLSQRWHSDGFILQFYQLELHFSARVLPTSWDRLYKLMQHCAQW